MTSFMSFLTLGLTADAAAAHRHEFSSSSVASTPASSYQSQSLGSQTPRNSTALNPLTTILPESRSITPISTPTTPAPRPEPTPKQKVPRPKTSYHLAPPPPSTHSNRIRAVVRPTRALILQVQRLHASARPVPAFDVIPALAFATKRKRPLGLRVLGMNDFVVLSSEEYTGQGDEDDGEEDLSSRSVIALICPKKDREDDGVLAYMEMAGGAIWVVSQRNNGSYEFVCHQANGDTLTARWIARLPNSRRRSSQMTTPVKKDLKISVQSEKKFQFSMINPNTRRHPILANMTGQKIDVFDQYSIPMNVSSRPSTPGENSRADAMSVHSQSGEEEERMQVQTDDTLRTLIILTGTWVALRENFNGRSWFDEPIATPSTPAKTTTLSQGRNAPATPSRTSFSLKTPYSTVDISSKPDGRYSLEESLHRRGTQLAHQVTTGSVRIVEDESASASARRAHSIGSAFKRPMRSTSLLSSSKLASSSQESPTSTRAPSPEIALVPAAHAEQYVEDTAPPIRQKTPLLKHLKRSSISAPNSPSEKPAKTKGGWKRLSLPPRALNKRGDEKKTLKQKFNRVFSFLGMNGSGQPPNAG